MPRRVLGSRFPWPLAVAALAAASCGPDFGVPSSEKESAQLEYGTAAFALTATAAEKSFALRNAQFVVTGAENVVLQAADETNESSLIQELPSGPYSVELKPGYRLVEVTNNGDVEVDSALESPNPQSVLVAPAQTTEVNYLFRTAGQPVTFGPGSLAIAIQVEKADVPGLVISEFMVNPSAVSDSAGEWIEIANTSSEALSLQGCRVLRDGSGFTIDAAVTVPPNGFVTLANGSSPGFSPTHVYSGLTLPNSATFTLTLECNSVAVDEITIEPSSWPLASGISAALDTKALSSSKNDVPSAWCLSTKVFATDFGTPGAANDSCSR